MVGRCNEQAGRFGDSRDNLTTGFDSFFAFEYFAYCV